VSNTDARDRSGERLPPRGHQNTNTMMDLRPSQLPGQQPYSRKANSSQIHLPPPSQLQSVAVLPSPIHYVQQQQMPTMPYDCRIMDLSAYPAPHPASPLGKNLNKLLPQNDTTTNFFNSMFQ
jgi:hypothetical protein